jgi:SAM-dependent methyltransferase
MTSRLDQATAGFYDSYVADGAIRAESPQSAISAYFSSAFKAGDKVLDIGSGSGRDLAVLLDRGMDAYGIEPGDAMRAFALQKHPQLAARLESGALPITGVPFGGQFDGVVCNAVLMHVPDDRFLRAWESIRRLLKPHGRVLVSLPAMRADLLDNDRDRDGRFFRNHSPGFVNAVATSLGFSQIDLGSQAISRYPDVTWSIFLFALSAHGTG